MRSITKIVLIALATFTLSAITSAEPVEVYLLDRLDGILNEYCIDVSGPPQRMTPENPLQAHTCYSYREDPTADQAMDSEAFELGKIHLISEDLCVQADDVAAGSTVSLHECADTDTQHFELRDNGHIVLAQHAEMCLTAGPTSRFGGPAGGPPSQHQIRTLQMQHCGDEAVKYQTWGIRTEMPAG